MLPTSQVGCYESYKWKGSPTPTCTNNYSKPSKYPPPTPICTNNYSKNSNFWGWSIICEQTDTNENITFSQILWRAVIKLFGFAFVRCERTFERLCCRYKGKSYRATVEICRATDQIEEFCRQICIRLECCPNMFSPHYVNDSCPENCSQLTKTKYSK